MFNSRSDKQDLGSPAFTRGTPLALFSSHSKQLHFEPYRVFSTVSVYKLHARVSYRVFRFFRIKISNQQERSNFTSPSFVAGLVSWRNCNHQRHCLDFGFSCSNLLLAQLSVVKFPSHTIKPDLTENNSFDKRFLGISLTDKRYHYYRKSSTAIIDCVRR